MTCTRTPRRTCGSGTGLRPRPSIRANHSAPPDRIPPVPWPTWDQAAVAALLSGLVWLGVRRWPSRATPHVQPAAAEFALIASLYAVWRLARMLPIASTHGAIQRAHEIASFQGWLHLPSELTLQRFVLAHARLADLTTRYYAALHVPALIAFLVWLFYRHRDKYPHWRN